MLAFTDPTAAGFRPEGLSQVRSLLRSYAGRDPARHAYPGAVLGVAREGRLVLCEAVGEATPSPAAEPLRMDHIFDVASLTKVVATAPAVLLLLERGQLCLDDRVDVFFPEFLGRPLGEATIRHLLTHTSGISGPVPLWQLIPEHGSAVRALASLAPTRRPGAAVEYSCAGYVLLGLIVEALTGEPFDEFTAREIFMPLGLTETTFLPVGADLPAGLAGRLVPTERRSECPQGRGLLRQVEAASNWPAAHQAAWRARHDAEGRPQGVVHDENAAFLGGRSGNAGLFSTVTDLLTYGQLWLSGGQLGEVRLFGPETVGLATRNWTPGLADSRGLGWQLPGGDNSFGDLLARESFGHTGFTGTGLWLDPVHRMAVVLLTNRLQLGRTNERLFRVRKLILNSLVAALE